MYSCGTFYVFLYVYFMLVCVCTYISSRLRVTLFTKGGDYRVYDFLFVIIDDDNDVDWVMMLIEMLHFSFHSVLGFNTDDWKM